MHRNKSGCIKRAKVVQFDSMALCVMYSALFIYLIAIRIGLQISFPRRILQLGLYSSTVGIQIDKRHQVELIEGLNLYNTSYRGLVLVEGYHHLSPAVLLKGELRELQLPMDICMKALHILSQSNEFTLMATLKQEQKNAGTILSFSEGNNRYLELQSSGRKNEIRLHYNHHNMVHVETFPYHLADNRWHLLSVTISGNNVALYVDCHRIYKRIINDIDWNFVNRNLSLWLGQRNFQHFFFKGSLQDVRIVGKSHGYIVQCPHLEADCPTCGQFRQLEMSVRGLEIHVKDLIERLAHAEQRIAAVEECECQKNCHVNGSEHVDGASWQHKCEMCFCVQGTVQCKPVNCPLITCKYPVMQKDKCCPSCLKKCFLDEREYDDGEEFGKNHCVICKCENGVIKCRRINPDISCPVLLCPEYEQFSVPGQCCRFCPGTDFCSQGHNCHINATCLNLQTRHVCQCNTGYHGDGTHCEDIDECQTEGGHYGHHCRRNTTCINFPGFYVCECLIGYKRLDAFNCIEHDECDSNDHKCSENALCTNTDGSYVCHCKEGYVGDGFTCEPVCNQTCLNGGQCIAPDVCGCHRGYTGPNCEVDIDECQLGLHICHSNAQCVNMPGWYYCECHQGYQSHYKNRIGIYCEDINECSLGTHTCHHTATCVNKDGSFRCECLNITTCSFNCIYHGEEKNNGEVWTSLSDPCIHCSCYNGVVVCERSSCVCSDSNIDLMCCPECDDSSLCHHQETPVTFRNGEKWTYQCQTCECLYGEVDCWETECPPINCDNPIHRVGDCCLRCEEEPCLPDEISNKNNLTLSLGCTYHGHMYRSGETIPIVQDPCAFCKCQVPHCEHSVSNTGYSSHRMDGSAARTVPFVWTTLLSLLLTCRYCMIATIWKGFLIITDTSLHPRKTVQWKMHPYPPSLLSLPLLPYPVSNTGSHFNNSFLCQRTSNLKVMPPKRNLAERNSINIHTVPI